MLSKLVAGREKDVAFARDALAAGIVERRVLLERIGDLPVDARRREDVRAAVEAL